MVEGEDCERASNSCGRIGMKRASEAIGVVSEVESDGSSDFERGKSGEKLTGKKIRVSVCSRALEGFGVDIEGKEIEGNENRIEGSEDFGPIDEKVSGSEEACVGIEAEENGGIEDWITGVEELGSVAEDGILSSKVACDSGGDRDKEQVGVKENKKVGGLEGVGIDFEVKENQTSGFEELGFRIENNMVLSRSEGCKMGDTEEEENEKSDHVRKLEKVGPSSGCGSSKQMSELIVIVDDPEGEVKLDLDLNVPVLEADDCGTEMNCQEYTQMRPVIAERMIEIIDISCDDCSDVGENLGDARDAGGKNKELEIRGFDLDLGTMVRGQAADGSSSQIVGRRYTREEKGKAKLVDSWLSLATNPVQLDLKLERQEPIKSAVSGCIQLYETSQPRETTQLQGTENLGFRMEQAILSGRAARASRQRANTVRNREILSRQARRFAHYNPQQEDESFKQEQKTPSIEADKELEDLPGPFSTALRMLRGQNLKRNAQQLIEWKPSGDHDHNILMPLVPSLLDLCLKVLAMNAEAIVSLEPIPDALKRRLTDLLCNLRRMNIHVLELLARGSPTEIRIKDCSWITEEQFTKTFGSFEAKNLRVLQLDLCGQCVLDDILDKTLSRSSNSLPSLGILSLRGACRLSDIALKALVASAPALRSINLGQCSLLTDTGVNILSNSMGSILRELYIDDCQRIDAMLIVPALKKFEHLEVLSVAGIQTVCDEFVSEIITACGQNIKELDLADCWKLTDTSLKVIGNTCSELCSLNISNLHKLTDLGIQFLANGCRSIQTLKLCRNGFSDEAIAAFLEASGKSLKELSLNNVSKVGCSTALSLAKCSRKLLSLDLSWCRRITNEALALIVHSCLSLKLLKLFGCTQITNVFLNGHSNSLLQIIGLNLTPVLEHLNMLEPEEVLLRYSPLPFSSDS